MVIRGTTNLGAAVRHGIDQRATELEPSRQIDYLCPGGHIVGLTFAATAEVPPVWDCRHCGRPAHRHGRGHTAPEDSPDVPARHRDSTWTRTARSQAQASNPRTPWIMLRERRTLPELQSLFDERLALLHAARQAASRAAKG